MNLIDLIVNKGLEALGRYYSTYRAIVVDNKQDEQNRLSVIIPSICNTPILAYPKGQEGNQDSGFKWFTPTPGQVVYVEFIQGDLAYPLWSYHGWAKDEIPDELKPNTTMGFKSKRGHLITLDEDERKLRIIITDEDEEEATELLIVDNHILVSTIKDGEEYTRIELHDEVSITTKAEIKLNAKKLILNGGDTGLPTTPSLVTKLSKLESEMNTLKAAMKVGAPAILAIAPTFSSVRAWSLTPPIVITKPDDLANKDILQ
jgi:hypothetical protein